MYERRLGVKEGRKYGGAEARSYGGEGGRGQEQRHGSGEGGKEVLKEAYTSGKDLGGEERDMYLWKEARAWERGQIG